MPSNSAEYNKRWRELNRERNRDYWREYRTRKHAERLAYDANYREAHREEKRAYDRKRWAERDAEAWREKRAAYRATHRKELSEAACRRLNREADECGVRYGKRLLAQHSTVLKMADIPDALAEAKAAQIKLRRYLNDN